MPVDDVAVKPMLAGAVAVAAIVALAIAAALGLLTLWHEPFGGATSGAARFLPALAASGPALQSAPQLDHARYLVQKARERAASEAAR